MEYADDGDLYQKIVDRKKKKELFEESEIWSVLIQTVIGLKTLHSLNILHRDLKVLQTISRVLISSWPRQAKPNSGTSMSLKSPKMAFSILKLEHPIMPVLRSGRTSHTMPSQIFGRLDALYIKWLHSNPLLRRRIWRDYSSQWLWECILQLIKSIQRNLHIW